MNMSYLKSSWKASHHHHQVHQDQHRLLCWSLQLFILQELPYLLLLVLVIHPPSDLRLQLLQQLPLVLVLPVELPLVLVLPVEHPQPLLLLVNLLKLQ